jgi:hypothetical protein
MTPLDIIKFSRGIQANLITELDNASNIRHPTAQGDEGERAWTDFLNKSLPRRYAVRSGQILDSHGNTSDQIDVILYDPQYTPVWFPLREHAYVLAEAVYAVFEVKPKLEGNIEYAADKAASVRRLHRTSAPVPHSDGLKPPKAPFPILAGILARESGWKTDAQPLLADHLAKHLGDRRLDLGIALDTGAFEFAPTAATPLAYLPGDTALVHFLYRLLARLQALGTVPAIDWSAYANRFGAAAPLA